MSDQPRVGVITFPGSLDDGDMQLALARLGADPVAIWHADDHLPEGVGAVVLPGGFSYGDYLRRGAIARFAPIMAAVRAFAADGGPVLGVCNGFQILCEAGLLPGVLRANRQLEYVCRDVVVTVQETGAHALAAVSTGTELAIPVKHGEGNWYATDDLFRQIEAAGQVALRYTDDVNGSLDRVAGVCNRAGNVLGLMPHPEHAIDALLGPTGGIPILEGLVAAARRRSPVGAAV